MKVNLFVALALVAVMAAPVRAQESNGETLVLTLEDALKIALSENISVKVADQEVTRLQYARKGTYASLFPQVDASAAYQRTIKKQVMYMDFDMGSIIGGGGSENPAEGQDIPEPSVTPQSKNGGGIEVGRLNTYTAGVSASMPLINAQLWKSLQLSGQEVELAVEKARSSRLEMVTQVKQAYYSVLLAREAVDVYREVYDNALENLRNIEKKYDAGKASELEYTRAKTSVANAVPGVCDAESSEFLALWQLKAVIGIDLDREIDVAGALSDYAQTMFREIHEHDDASLENNTTMRQLAIQAEELANTVKMQKYASLPSLALAYSYSYNAMTNDFNFSEYHWSPYSYVGLSLSIPIFAGGKRHAAVRQAQVQSRELELQTKNTERQLQIAIRQYLNQMETNMKSYGSAESAVEMASKAYDIAQKSYDLGRGTLTDLHDSQLALTQARLSTTQAVYGFLVAKANLEQVLGNDFLEETDE